MKNFGKIFVLIATVGGLIFGQQAAAQEAPDALLKRISQQIMDLAKTDKDIQVGNQKRVLNLVEAKILPHIDFPRMTALAAGRSWREATPEQQNQLIAEFKTLLIFTYSGAIAQVQDLKFTSKPMRGEPADGEVEVLSEVMPPRGESIQINYRLEMRTGTWKIYDVSVLGAWLVESYQSSFSAEISRGGVDGLINVLSIKNRKLATGAS